MTESFTVEQSQKVFDVNTFGPLRVIRAALPHMRKQKSGLLIRQVAFSLVLNLKLNHLLNTLLLRHNFLLTEMHLEL